jgi:hypothetical protein
VITVAGVFYFQYYMSLPQNQGTFTIDGTNLASVITSLLSTIVITVRTD